MDAHKNFAYSTVATAPSPASSGTSLVVAAGGGALLPAVPFNATVWPSGVQPLASNAEVVRVTAKSTDTLTITRAQEGSSARSIVVGDQIAATITNKTLTDIESATGAGSDTTAVHYLQYDTTGAVGASSALQTAIDAGFRNIVIPAGLFKADAAVFYDQQDGNSTLRLMANGCVFVAQTTLPTVTEWNTFATGRGVATGCKFFLFPSTARAALSAGVVTVTGNDVAGTATYPVARNGVSPHLIVDGGTFDANLLTNFNGGFIFANRGGAVEIRSVHMSSARMLCCSSGYVDAMKMMNCSGWGSVNMTSTYDAALFYQIDSGDGVYILGCKTDNYILTANLTSCNGAHINGIVGGGVKLTNCHGIKIDANHTETATNISVVPRIIYDIRDSHVTIDTSFDYLPENQTTLGAVYINDSGGEGQQSTVDLRNYFGRHWVAASDSTSGYAIYINNMNDRSQINVYFSGSQMSVVGAFATAYGQTGLTIGGNATNEPTLAAALVAGRDLIGSGTFQIYKYKTTTMTTGQNVPMTIGIGQIGNLAGLYRATSHVTPTFYDAESYGSGTLANSTLYAYAAAVCNTLPNGTIQYGAATAEWQQTTPGSGGAQGFEMYTPSGGNGATIVIWRKTGAGVLATPDRYIVIPIGTGATRFLDTGANLNGLPWITTSVPVPNTVAATNHTADAIYMGSSATPIYPVAIPGGVTSTGTPSSSTFLRGDGAWATPSGGGAVATDVIWDTKGDIAAATGADAAVKVAVGSNGQVLTADSAQTAGVKWAAAGGGGGTDPTDPLNPKLFEDFLGGNLVTNQIGALGWGFANGPTPSWIAPVANHPGIIQIGSTTTANTYSTLYLGLSTTDRVFVNGADLWDVTFWVRPATNDANTILRVGVNANAGSIGGDGAYFEKLAADTNWFATTKGASTTRTDSTVAVAANTWVKLRVRMTNSTTVGFTVNAGTEITITTNLPTLPVLPFVNVSSSTTTAKTLDVDACLIAVTGLSR